MNILYSKKYLVYIVLNKWIFTLLCTHCYKKGYENIAAEIWFIREIFIL